eukprot:TRINITY_DN665_c2_g1_i1.p1 TRINITY_DN665_c2_g1~~TRINITY_DN665_c2_g1_i1.p1  ORF type:complete len:627 (+),score=200.74 TRINITY_DN665_c2_g1_i1:115-1995(+)
MVLYVSLSFVFGWICCVVIMKILFTRNNNMVKVFISNFDEKYLERSNLKDNNGNEKKKQLEFIKEFSNLKTKFSQFDEVVNQNNRILKSLSLHNNGASSKREERSKDLTINKKRKNKKLEQIIENDEDYNTEDEDIEISDNEIDISSSEVTGKNKKDKGKKKLKEISKVSLSLNDLLRAKDEEEIIKEGQLYLKTDRSWQKRHLRLFTSVLSIYKNPNCNQSDCLAHISLINCSVDNDSKGFKIKHKFDSPIVRIVNRNNIKNDSFLILEDSSKCEFYSKELSHLSDWQNIISNSISEATVLLENSEIGSDKNIDYYDDDDELVLSDDDNIDTQRYQNKMYEAVEEEEEKEEEEVIERNLENIIECAQNQNEEIALNTVVEILGDELEDTWFTKAFKNNQRIKIKNRSGFDLLRFLRARQFDPNKASDLLRNHFKFLKETNPQNIDFKKIEFHANKKKAEFHMYDKGNHPIIIVDAGSHKANDDGHGTERIILFLLYMVETSIKHMDPEIEKFTVIFDCINLNFSQIDYSTVKEAIGVLQEQYPERLGTLFVINYHWLINTVYKGIKKLLNERTVKKIQFVDKKVLPDFVHPDCLPVRYGGNSTYRPPDGEIGEETLYPGFVPTLI